jgi:hypothetical protein
MRAVLPKVMINPLAPCSAPTDRKRKGAGTPKRPRPLRTWRKCGLCGPYQYFTLARTYQKPPLKPKGPPLRG